jgi:hypothetical protein
MAVDVRSPSQAAVGDAGGGGAAEHSSGAPSCGALVLLCLLEAAWIGALIGAAIFGAVETSEFVHGLF